MQNRIKAKPPLFALVPVPYEALVEAEIELGQPMQFTVTGGKITMEHIVPNETDFDCGGSCEDCPLFLLDCAGDCAGCPYNKDHDESEAF